MLSGLSFTPRNSSASIPQQCACLTFGPGPPSKILRISPDSIIHSSFDSFWALPMLSLWPPTSPGAIPMMSLHGFGVQKVSFNKLYAREGTFPRNFANIKYNANEKNENSKCTRLNSPIFFYPNSWWLFLHNRLMIILI